MAVDNNRHSSGFTLIELLIVVAIISVLAVTALVAYTTFNQMARDAKRQSDLKLIQSALEDCRADTLAYPAIGPAISGSVLTCNGRTYLNQVPADPKNNSYIYNQIGGGTDYQLCANNMERVPAVCVNRP